MKGQQKLEQFKNKLIKDMSNYIDERYTQALANYSKMLPGLQDAFNDEMNDQLYG